VLRIRNKEGEEIRSVDVAMFTDQPESVYVFFTSTAIDNSHQRRHHQHQHQHQHKSFPCLHMLEFTYSKTILTLSKVYSDLFSHSITSDMLK
jgi:hypothetical protein